jgi:hypothetical protein
VFPVRYELNLYILIRRNSVFKGLSYVRDSRLEQNYYSGMGRHCLACGEMSGGQNFCLTSELDHRLLTPVYMYIYIYILYALKIISS